jgi:3-isopropylmalate/(R)-2-methylmalate dehydratase small subunit
VQLSDNEMEIVFTAIEKNPATEIEINLENQTVSIPSVGKQFAFDIDPYKKYCLMNGFSDLDFLLSIKDKVIAFEEKHLVY